LFTNNKKWSYVKKINIKKLRNKLYISYYISSYYNLDLKGFKDLIVDPK